MAIAPHALHLSIEETYVSQSSRASRPLFGNGLGSSVLAAGFSYAIGRMGLSPSNSCRQARGMGCGPAVRRRYCSLWFLFRLGELAGFPYPFREH
jgi:hypothetical protein